MRRPVQMLAAVLCVAAMLAAAPAAWAAKTISTAEYATRFCQSGGPFRTAIALASAGLNVSSQDLPTVRTALVKFADGAHSATDAFRRDLVKLRTVKSPALRAVNAKTIARLGAIEKVLTTTKRDASRLNVNDPNGFGIALVNVQKDLVEVSNGYASIGKIKSKALDRAVANDSVCQQLEGATPTTVAP